MVGKGKICLAYLQLFSKLLLTHQNISTLDSGPWGWGREWATLCPIDIAPINKAMLTPTEKEWLNNYHSVVRQRLMPHLNDEADRNWLLKATEAI